MLLGAGLSIIRWVVINGIMHHLLCTFFIVIIIILIILIIFFPFFVLLNWFYLNKRVFTFFFFLFYSASPPSICGREEGANGALLPARLIHNMPFGDQHGARRVETRTDWTRTC